MALTRIADLQQRIEELRACVMRSPGWSIPVLSRAPSVTARSCRTSKSPPPQQPHRPEVTVMRIELLTSPGCPNADAARRVIADCLANLGIDVLVIDRVGQYPSPTVLVDGVDVMRPAAGVPSGDMCRLDLPTPQRILDALRAHRPRRLTPTRPLAHPSRLPPPPDSSRPLSGNYTEPCCAVSAITAAPIATICIRPRLRWALTSTTRCASWPPPTSCTSRRVDRSRSLTHSLAGPLATPFVSPAILLSQRCALSTRSASH